MSEFSLDTMNPGEKGFIHQITSKAPGVRQRLMEMGLIKGTPIELVRFAPMGDPIEVRVRGCRLSLRKVEAQAIVVRREGVA